MARKADRFPVRPQGLAFICLFLCFWLLSSYVKAVRSLSVLLPVAFILGVVFAVVFLISFFSYLGFAARAREYIKSGDAVRLAIGESVSLGSGARLSLGVPGKRTSAFLSVRAVLEFAGGQRSEALTLDRRTKESLSLSGQADVPDALLGCVFDFSGLPSGRYEVKESVLRFEDPLGLFRFVYAEREKNFAFTVFNAADRELDIEGRPERAETEYVSRERTKMDGELLDIRKYVPGSDPSRRIVWKLFARTGRLMVRDAEKENVNSARLPLFVSFFARGRPALPPGPGAGLLEEYKSTAYAVMKKLREANYQPVYCPERRVVALESGDSGALAAFDRELEIAPENLRAEVEMACHRWQCILPLGRQIDAWEGALRGMESPRERLILVTHSLDDSWLEALTGTGEACVVYFKRLSREIMKRPDGRSAAERLLFVREEKRDWELSGAGPRLKYGALERALKLREEEALSLAASRSIQVIEL
jgi:hypothetical protein